VVTTLLSLGVDNPLTRLLFTSLAKINIGFAIVYVCQNANEDSLIWQHVFWFSFLCTFIAFLAMIVIKTTLDKSTFSSVVPITVIVSLLTSVAVYVDGVMKTHFIVRKAYGQMWRKHNTQPSGNNRTMDLINENNSLIYDRMVSGERSFKYEDIKSLNLQQYDWITLRVDEKTIYLEAIFPIDNNLSEILASLITSNAATMLIVLVIYLIMNIGSLRSKFITTRKKKSFL